jgi:small subunit ribosomal protein S11
MFMQHSRIVLLVLQIYLEMFFVGHHQVSVVIKGEKKRSYYVAGAVGRDLGFKLKRQRKMKKLSVILKGPGRGRLNVIKGLARSGIQITRIVDRTPRAFNGCRPRKRRRIRGNS